jgi:hypothetical protein
MAQMMSASFGPGNQGVEVGYNYRSISTEFHLPPGTVTAAPCELRNALLTPSERLETPPPPSAIIPFSRDPDFVNRGDILNQIDKRCSEPAARVALVGLGGVSKSQLAIELAYWIAAGQPGT